MKKCPFCGKQGHIFTHDMSEYTDSNEVYYKPGCLTKDCICYRGIGECTYRHIIDAVNGWNKRAE